MLEPDIYPVSPDPVVDNRFTWFRKLGFTVSQSQTLAEQGADHHEAESLLRRGCPRDIAFDILAD